MHHEINKSRDEQGLCVCISASQRKKTFIAAHML